jgi:hypothetical protein
VDDILKGQRAQHVIQVLDELKVFEQLRTDIVAGWMSAKTKETREEHHARMKVLDSFIVQLTKLVNDGEYARSK